MLKVSEATVDRNSQIIILQGTEPRPKVVLEGRKYYKKQFGIVTMQPHKMGEGSICAMCSL